MFSFFIGLVIALFIAIAGFGGFLFKLSNANKADIKNNQFSLPETQQDLENSNDNALETEKEALPSLNASLSKPDFSAGSY